MADSPFVVTVTAENFHQVILEGSRERPVLVDFWADWCAPCRSLMPILAKLAEEYAGAFILAKVNTDEEREIAAQFGIRSLPTVALMVNGQPVDQFMGALPEGEVRRFLEPHVQAPAQSASSQFEDILAMGDLAGAEAALEDLKANEPDNERLPILAIQLQAAKGDSDGAMAAIEALPPDLTKDPAVSALRGRLHFAAQLADSPDEASLRARLEDDDGDSEARYLLALHQIAGGDITAGLDDLLTLLKRDRAFQDDAARKAMIMVFDLPGVDPQIVASYRSKMLNTLF